MRRPKIKGHKGLLAGMATLLVVFLACSVDTPTAPTQEPAPPPTTGQNLWKVTVTVSPRNLPVDGEQPAQVVAMFESRTSPGTYPPGGTTMVFDTSIGTFSGDDVVQSTAAVISQGKASVFLFPGTVAGTGTVRAVLAGSVGREQVTVSVVEEPQDPFILSITPNTGPAGGGTTVTITGTGFRTPLRVFFGDKLGTIISASSTTIVVSTPPGDIDTQDCDDDDDGNIGLKSFDTPVGIKIEMADGTSEDLPNAFTYTVFASGVCIGD